jgi:glucose-1-phosphatase
MNRSIQNIIFDLGGVILDLSVPSTLESFSKLSGIDQQKVKDIFVSAEGFEIYEKGGMNDQQFRDFIREVYSVKATDAEIDKCWNAMLRGIPVSKLRLLEALMKKYNVFLLSNTNNIHHNYINAVTMPATGTGKLLEDYFHKAYYSHRMLKRKPDADIYLQVLEENNFLPEQTLFLDDNASNVEGAKKVGIQSVLVDSPNFILDYFNG